MDRKSRETRKKKCAWSCVGSCVAVRVVVKEKETNNLAEGPLEETKFRFS